MLSYLYTCCHPLHIRPTSNDLQKDSNIPAHSVVGDVFVLDSFLLLAKVLQVSIRNVYSSDANETVTLEYRSLSLYFSSATTIVIIATVDMRARTCSSHANNLQQFFYSLSLAQEAR